ncbi:unnamed protein product [Polarella glacialis]|uniref:Uncharacterized protein n=1 Tax=Polarella glacialis TaxID=89957 RepID=A0A813GL32_POLGL|nr:unnamed protein product [Polarella glacialis]
MNSGLEGFLSAEDDWDERGDFTVEVDEHAEDVLEIVTMDDSEDFFPTVYGITLSASSRTTAVVWVSRVEDKVLACFPGKAFTGRRVSATGPLLARGAATASGSSRDSGEEEAPECAMKADLAFLTLDAMSLSLPMGLAAQDPDLLRFTSAAGEELWPWRYSVLAAAEKFAGEGGSPDPAPRRASVAGTADAAGPGLQQIVDGGMRRSAWKASSKASSKKPPSLPPPSLGGAGGPAMREAEQGGLSQADLEVLAKILQGGQATRSKLQARRGAVGGRSSGRGGSPRSAGGSYYGCCLGEAHGSPCCHAGPEFEKLARGDLGWCLSFVAGRLWWRWWRGLVCWQEELATFAPQGFSRATGVLQQVHGKSFAGRGARLCGAFYVYAGDCPSRADPCEDLPPNESKDCWAPSDAILELAGGWCAGGFDRREAGRVQSTSPSPSCLWGTALPGWWLYAACAGARGRGNASLRFVPTARRSWELGSALECFAEPYHACAFRKRSCHQAQKQHRPQTHQSCSARFYLS